MVSLYCLSSVQKAFKRKVRKNNSDSPLFHCSTTQTPIHPLSVTILCGVTGARADIETKNQSHMYSHLRALQSCCLSCMRKTPEYSDVINANTERLGKSTQIGTCQQSNPLQHHQHHAFLPFAIVYSCAWGSALRSYWSTFRTYCRRPQNTLMAGPSAGTWLGAPDCLLSKIIDQMG